MLAGPYKFQMLWHPSRARKLILPPFFNQFQFSSFHPFYILTSFHHFFLTAFLSLLSVHYPFYLSTIPFSPFLSLPASHYINSLLPTLTCLYLLAFSMHIPSSLLCRHPGNGWISTFPSYCNNSVLGVPKAWQELATIYMQAFHLNFS